MNTSDFEHPVILFDGFCNLCNRFVRIIIKHDRSAIFKMGSLQSETGKSFLSKHNINIQPDTVILFENGRVYTKSKSVFKIIKRLQGWPSWFYPLVILPLFISDYLYDFIALKRYQWFGKTEECLIPDENLKNRFI